MGKGIGNTIEKRFTDRGWLGLGEHQSLKPSDVAQIVTMAY